MVLSSNSRSAENPGYTKLVFVTFGNFWLMLQRKKCSPQTKLISPGMHFPLVVWLQHFGAPIMALPVPYPPTPRSLIFDL